MRSTKPTVVELAAELTAAYELIECALPLALRLLRTDEVALQNQKWFWSAVRGMEEHIDLLDDMENVDNPFDSGPSGLLMQRDELLKLVNPEIEEGAAPGEV